MSYWQLFYHFVWTTKHRQPHITPEIEDTIYELVRTKAIGLGGVVYAVGGHLDHVHLVTSVPPRLALATFIGKVKGSTTARFNQLNLLPMKLYWQEEYGVFSFDAKKLPNFIAYVKNQKRHHTQNTTIPVLERIARGEPRLLRESGPLYLAEDPLWREELLSLEEDF